MRHVVRYVGGQTTYVQYYGTEEDYVYAFTKRENNIKKKKLTIATKKVSQSIVYDTYTRERKVSEYDSNTAQAGSCCLRPVCRKTPSLLRDTKFLPSPKTKQNPVDAT